MVGHRLAVIIFKIFKCGSIVTVIDTIAILVRSDYIVFRFRKIMLITAVQAQTHIFLGPVLKSVVNSGEKSSSDNGDSEEVT